MITKIQMIILNQKSAHAKISQYNLVMLARMHFLPCFMVMHAVRHSFNSGNEVTNLPACLLGPVHTALRNIHCYHAYLTRQYYAELAVQAALFCLPHKTALSGTDRYHCPVLLTSQDNIHAELSISVALFSTP
jgi:hypothetical protein